MRALLSIIKHLRLIGLNKRAHTGGRGLRCLSKFLLIDKQQKSSKALQKYEEKRQNICLKYISFYALNRCVITKAVKMLPLTSYFLSHAASDIHSSQYYRTHQHDQIFTQAKLNCTYNFTLGRKKYVKSIYYFFNFLYKHAYA